MNKFILVFVVVMVLAAGYWFLSNQEVSGPTPPEPNNDNFTSEEIASEPQSTDQQVYLNEEWGFSFGYSNEWRISENSFSGFYTKFSLTIFPVEGKYYGRPVLVHIVDPVFIENSFSNLDKTEEAVEIDGIAGTKYTYDWKDEIHTVVILPIKESQMILGTNGHYPDLYSSFLESFEFVD